MPKLYEVTFEITAYVLAEDEDEAIDLAGGEVQLDFSAWEYGSAVEVGPSSPMAAKWDKLCLIYHGDRDTDIKLGDVWPKATDSGKE